MIRTLILLLLIFGTTSAKSQNQYSITYTGKLLSASFMSRLEKEVQDPFQVKAYAELLNGYEAHYSLHLDAKKGEALFLEDKEYGLDGPPPFKQLVSYYKAGNSLYFEDLFRGKIFKIKDKPQNLKWNISKESIKIGNFTCKKATLLADPFNTVAWFTEDYPLAFGPYFANGLPGLVVLLENEYYSIQVKEIKQVSLSEKITNSMKSMGAKGGISIANYYKEASPILKTMRQETIVN